MKKSGKMEIEKRIYVCNLKMNIIMIIIIKIGKLENKKIIPLCTLEKNIYPKNYQP